MKRLAFPTLFTFVLLGLWIFSRAQGGAAPSSTSPSTSQGSSQGKQSTKATKPAPKPDELTDKEEMFAATLSPHNEEVFTGWMNKKQRTMAMEMVIENHRSGGGLTPDQIVEQLSKDFNLAAPPPQRPATEAPAPKATPPAQPAPMQATPHSTAPPPTNTMPAHPAPMSPEATPANPMPQTPESQAGTSASPPKRPDW